MFKNYKMNKQKLEEIALRNVSPACCPSNLNVIKGNLVYSKDIANSRLKVMQLDFLYDENPFIAGIKRYVTRLFYNKVL